VNDAPDDTSSTGVSTAATLLKHARRRPRRQGDGKKGRRRGTDD
jgi:hypothetical protein